MTQRRSAALMFRPCSWGAYATAACIKNNFKKKKWSVQTGGFSASPWKESCLRCRVCEDVVLFLMGSFYRCIVSTLSESYSLGINTECREVDGIAKSGITFVRGSPGLPPYTAVRNTLRGLTGCISVNTATDLFTVHGFICVCAFACAWVSVPSSHVWMCVLNTTTTCRNILSPQTLGAVSSFSLPLSPDNR